MIVAFGIPGSATSSSPSPRPAPSQSRQARPGAPVEHLRRQPGRADTSCLQVHGPRGEVANPPSGWVDQRTAALTQRHRPTERPRRVVLGIEQGTDDGQIQRLLLACGWAPLHVLAVKPSNGAQSQGVAEPGGQVVGGHVLRGQLLRQREVSDQAPRLAATSPEHPRRLPRRLHRPPGREPATRPRRACTAAAQPQQHQGVFRLTAVRLGVDAIGRPRGPQCRVVGLPLFACEELFKSDHGLCRAWILGFGVSACGILLPGRLRWFCLCHEARRRGRFACGPRHISSKERGHRPCEEDAPP